MGHGACRRYAVIPVGHDAGRAGTTADIGRSGAQNGAIAALSTAGAEFQHRPPLSRPHHPVGFGGDQALVVDGEQHHGFDKLGLGHRATHGDDGFAGENGSAFGDAPYITGKFEVFQIVQKFWAEAAFAVKIFQILLGKAEVFQIVHQLLHAGHDGIAGIVRHIPVEHIKIGDGISHALFVIAIGHGKFVKIGEHGEIFVQFQGVHLRFFQNWGFFPERDLPYLHDIW